MLTKKFKIYCYGGGEQRSPNSKKSTPNEQQNIKESAKPKS